MKCIGLFGAIFGHSYAGRYSNVFPRDAKIKAARCDGDAREFEIIANAIKERHYCGDVCTRCGHTINAPKEAA